MIRSNLRNVWRGLAKSPGFTAVAMLTLALGIGANAVEAAAVSGAGAADADEQLLRFDRADAGIDVATDYRKHTDLFQKAMPVQSASFNYSGADGADSDGVHIRGFRRQTGRVRMVTEAEDRPGNDGGDLRYFAADDGDWDSGCFPASIRSTNLLRYRVR